MKGLLFALAGIKSAFFSELNLKYHSAIAFLAVLIGWCFNLSQTEWIMVVFCIGLVFITELLNTAIEYLVDLVSPGFDPVAGKVKDIAAGAVLVSAVTALVTGAIIFLPKIQLFFFSIFK